MLSSSLFNTAHISAVVPSGIVLPISLAKRATKSSVLGLSFSCLSVHFPSIANIRAVFPSASCIPDSFFASQRTQSKCLFHAACMSAVLPSTVVIPMSLDSKNNCTISSLPSSAAKISGVRPSFVVEVSSFCLLAKNSTASSFCAAIAYIIAVQPLLLTKPDSQPIS